MTSGKSWIGTASLLACALSTSSYAHAQSADALSAEAKKLLADGKTAEACKKFEESQRAEARGATLLDIADCHEKEGKTATAVADYKAAAAAAHKEKRYDREKTAKLRILALEPKQPRLSVTVAGGDVAGLDVAVDGVSLIKSEWGKPRPVDPGEHTAVATAPGRKPFEGKVTVANGEKKSLAVPALEKSESGAAAATPATPAKGPAPGTPAKPAEAAPPPSATASTAGKKDEPSGTKRQAGRLVAEAGALAGLLTGAFDTGDLRGVGDIAYEIKINSGGDTEIKSCQTQACEAHFDTTLGLLIGGEAFLGYAVTDTFHIGGRGFAAPRLKGGWFFAGGPAASLHVGPVWLGASFLVGAAQQVAKVAEVRGPIPADAQKFNGGAAEVVVPPSAGTPTEANVNAGIAFGGNAEISFTLVELDPGSILLAAWPLFMKGTNGYLVAIPAGLAFRLH